MCLTLLLPEPFDSALNTLAWLPQLVPFSLLILISIQTDSSLSHLEPE